MVGFAFSRRENGDFLGPAYRSLVTQASNIPHTNDADPYEVTDCMFRFWFRWFHRQKSGHGLGSRK
ncbi:hypothetical protein DTL42_09255 [Bremerella cremea]|uniref:Uncharacterized protein n=1 Tax=Bremerella cremea TaxID=1031537 RepID=A0A368KX94_9BACT|nr:hypothetical protein DTL42_09255 [Bremerella cremea]